MSPARKHTPKDVELEIPPRVEYLAMVRSVVGATAALDPRIPTDRIDDLRLAVSEATTNAIEANLAAKSKKNIEIRCGLTDDAVHVEVRDHGTGFDPDALVPHPPVTDPERLEFERGLGIPLMRKLADEHEIRPSKNGTVVRLVIYVRKKKRS